MDQSSYTFSALESKYEKFRAPSFEITVGSKVFTSVQYPIYPLTVELAADGSASGCTFVIEGQYNYTASKWENNLDGVIKPGAKLIVKGGYVKQKELFYGYVDDFELEYDGSGAPRITVTGIDGLGYLMSCGEPLYGEQKPAADLVKAILNKSVTAGFAKSVTVGSLTGYATPLVKEKEDDFKFLKMLAGRYGASLFALDGELIFKDVASKSTPLLTLTVGVGLTQFRKRISLAHQVGQVEICGRDVDQKPVKGSARSVSVGSSGKSAAQLVPALKKAKLQEFSEFVRTEAECVKLAQARLNSIAMGLVSGTGTCVGIPELIPGRYVKIEGVDKGTVGIYFLNKVTHSFTEEGYRTTFEVRGAKDG